MRHSISAIILAIAALIAAGCGQSKSVKVDCEPFGTLSSGEPVQLFTVTNPSRASMVITDYGARLLKLFVPDKDGNMKDVTVGYGTLDSLEFGMERFIGCTIGRFGNRIAHASYTLDGETVQLDRNETLEGEIVHLHGGVDGFDRKVWESTVVKEGDMAGVRFRYLSPDGDQGYPGNCDCTVTYWWGKDNVCRIEYAAVTDKPTVINLSNHTYFNLKGDEAGNVLDHDLWVDCDTCLIMNGQRCPDHKTPVEGTEFDYRTSRRIDSNPLGPNGSDACWLINGWTGDLKKIATLYSPDSGISMDIVSTEPCLLSWSGAWLTGGAMGKYAPMDPSCGILLETIHVPDSPNQPQFPSTVLRPGEKYFNCTEYHFTVR
ncbi:MAG: galactose mutarotase [Bacteroidales bacterium]|nr:galactose mutarotase [Bacteroidales bacterium]